MNQGAISQDVELGCGVDAEGRVATTRLGLVTGAGVGAEGIGYFPVDVIAGVSAPALQRTTNKRKGHRQTTRGVEWG